MPPGSTRERATTRFLGSGGGLRSHLVRLSEGPSTGNHAILKYTNPDTGEVRTVTVPMHDRIRIGTLQNIADQCGADDFDAWCRWIDDHR